VHCQLRVNCIRLKKRGREKKKNLNLGGEGELQSSNNGQLSLSYCREETKVIPPRDKKGGGGRMLLGGKETGGQETLSQISFRKKGRGEKKVRGGETREACYLFSKSLTTGQKKRRFPGKGKGSKKLGNKLPSSQHRVSSEKKRKEEKGISEKSVNVSPFICIIGDKEGKKNPRKKKNQCADTSQSSHPQLLSNYNLKKGGERGRGSYERIFGSCQYLYRIQSCRRKEGKKD